jgi:glycosyltransferase, family 2
MVSIIIVNYNTKQLTLDCIRSIYKYTKDIDFEVIVVDNASSDNSVEAIRESFPIVNVIEPKENLGFGRANNLGAKYAQGEYLFLLNSDTLLIENSIKKLYDFYTENQEKLHIGVLGCTLVDKDLNLINSGGDFPTIWKYIFDIPLRTINRIFKTKHSSSTRYIFNQPITKVDMVTGADMFLSKEIFDKVKGFDKRFFLYYEETNMEYNLTKLGYLHYIINHTKIIHLEGGSMAYSNWKRKIIYNSQTLYFKLNHPNIFWIYGVFELFIIPLRLLQLKYSFRENLEFIKDNIKNIFK